MAVPTNSPFREDDTVEAKFARDATWFVAGAQAARAWVLKSCTVGGIFGRRSQGRSLVAGPDGVLTRVEPEHEALEACLIVDLPGVKLV